MIFYIAVDPDGKKHVLTVEAEAKKLDKNYVEIDQPNDKASLKTLIQESFNSIHTLEGQVRSLQHDRSIAPVTIAASSETDEDRAFKEHITSRPDHPITADVFEETRPFQVEGNAKDGFPDVRGAWTGVQINAMFQQRSEHVQDICHAISRLTGPDLGYVAFQVSAQLIKPITIIGEPSHADAPSES